MSKKRMNPQLTITIGLAASMALLASFGAAGSSGEERAVPAPSTVVVTTTTEAPPNHRAVMESNQPAVTTTTLVPDLSDRASVEAMRELHGRCGEWHDLALSVGWSGADWPMLSRVLYKESRCNFDSWNRSDPMDGSMGLTQINTYWCLPVKYNPGQGGWLGERGILTECSQLFDPAVNLAAALAIYNRSGWSPWGL